MKRTAAALIAGAAFGIVLGGVGIAAAGDDGRDDARDDNQRSAVAVAQSQEITEDQAREIAIQAAGGGQVEKVELEVEDGGLQWHIDVIKDGVEFDVRIDADTGDVVRFRTDDGDDRTARDEDRDDDGTRDDDRDDGGRDDHHDADDDDDNSGPDHDAHDDDHDDDSGHGSDDD